MELLSLILGILGLIATIVGSGLAYMTYISPMIRFKCYLKHKNNWKIIHPRVEGLSDYYQYSEHPEFTIEEISDRRWDRDEPWMKRIMRPDKNCISYQIALRANGNIVHTESFLFMDGGRIYVPIPNAIYSKSKSEEDNTYYYDEIQVLLAGVLGKYHNDRSLEGFCNSAAILINPKLPEPEE